MATPKSAKLLAEEAADVERKSSGKRVLLAASGFAEPNEEVGPIKIREIPCLNDFVAILVSKIRGSIQLSEDASFKNEGIVVGIGPGVSDGNGGRLKSQLSLGDVVLFQNRNMITEINSDKPPYRGQRVQIFSEKSLICKLPPVEFELVK